MITVTVRPKVRTYAPDDFPPLVYRFEDRDMKTATRFAEEAELAGYAVTTVVAPPPSGGRGGWHQPDERGPDRAGRGDRHLALVRSSAYESRGDRVVSGGRVLPRGGAA